MCVAIMESWIINVESNVPATTTASIRLTLSPHELMSAWCATHPFRYYTQHTEMLHIRTDIIWCSALHKPHAYSGHQLLWCWCQLNNLFVLCLNITPNVSPYLPHMSLPFLLCFSRLHQANITYRARIRIRYKNLTRVALDKSDH